MSYDAQETSLQDGHPIELYDFEWGSQHEHYTNGDTDYVDGVTTYRSIPIKRSKTSVNSAGKVSNIMLTVPRDHDVAGLFIGHVPGREIWVTIKRLHLTEPGAPEIVVYWKGRITSGVEWKGDFAEIHAAPIDSLFDREGLRRPYLSTCPHMLYGEDCTLIREVWQVTLAGADLTPDEAMLSATAFATKPDDYFQNGYISRNFTEHRMILSHTGTDLILVEPFDSIDAADVFNARAGCDKLWDTCKNRFSNSDNYGGFRFIPNINPFEVGLEG